MHRYKSDFLCSSTICFNHFTPRQAIMPVKIGDMEEIEKVPQIISETKESISIELLLHLAIPTVKQWGLVANSVVLVNTCSPITNDVTTLELQARNIYRKDRKKICQVDLKVTEADMPSQGPQHYIHLFAFVSESWDLQQDTRPGMAEEYNGQTNARFINVHSLINVILWLILIIRVIMIQTILLDNKACCLCQLVYIMTKTKCLESFPLQILAWYNTYSGIEWWIYCYRSYPPTPWDSLILIIWKFESMCACMCERVRVSIYCSNWEFIRIHGRNRCGLTHPC